MDREEHRELIRRLFALMTGKLEDAAGVAADGQAPAIEASAVQVLAARLRSASEEITTLSDAVLALVTDEPRD